jgi:uridine phosphorylase
MKTSLRTIAFALAFLPLIIGPNPARGQESPRFFNHERAIIDPPPIRGELPVSERVILTFSTLDFDLLDGLIGAAEPTRKIWSCPLREGSWRGKPVTIAGPAMGAPYAVMVLEMLIALKARMVLAFGWCGSLHSKVRIGHLVVPTAALSGEGTSRYYSSAGGVSKPDAQLCDILKARLAGTTATWHEGRHWSTDAIYRETVGLVRHHQQRRTLSVDMEMAALYAVGKFRGVKVAGLLVVSDELFTLTWNPGQDTPEFLQARELGAQVVLDTAAAWEGQ